MESSFSISSQPLPVRRASKTDTQRDRKGKTGGEKDGRKQERKKNEFKVFFSLSNPRNSTKQMSLFYHCHRAPLPSLPPLAFRSLGERKEGSYKQAVRVSVTTAANGASRGTGRQVKE